MTKTYAQIRQQIEALQTEAQALRQSEVKEVIARIREAITTYGLTAHDLGLAKGRKPRELASAKPSRKSVKSARLAKYKDSNGNTWGGRGPRPQWLREALAAGHELTEFLA